MQPALSPLRDASASGAATPPLPTSPPHLPKSQDEANREAFPRILLNWPLGHKASFFPKPIFQIHVGVSLDSRGLIEI